MAGNLSFRPAAKPPGREAKEPCEGGENLNEEEEDPRKGGEGHNEGVESQVKVKRGTIKE
jgi:hypothetical protein